MAMWCTYTSRTYGEAGRGRGGSRSWRMEGKFQLSRNECGVHKERKLCVFVCVRLRVCVCVCAY